jgi:hypothetical protein
MICLNAGIGSGRGTHMDDSNSKLNRRDHVTGLRSMAR